MPARRCLVKSTRSQQDERTVVLGVAGVAGRERCVSSEPDSRARNETDGVDWCGDVRRRREGMHEEKRTIESRSSSRAKSCDEDKQHTLESLGQEQRTVLHGGLVGAEGETVNEERSRLREQKGAYLPGPTPSNQVAEVVYVVEARLQKKTSRRMSASAT